MSRNYFVSDIHLGINSKERETKFLKFLSLLSPKDNLFILGDLFEFWLEYRLVIPKNSLKILMKLKELKDKGIEIYFLFGNHDYGLKNFLSKEFDFVIGEQFLDLNIEGKRVYIAHGDFIDDSFLTKVSQLMTKFKINRFLYSLIHPDIGLSLAHFFIHSTRIYGRDLTLKEAFYKFAENKIIKENYDVVILGHIHTPTLVKIGDGYYLNTGDWLINYTYGFIEGDNIELKKF